MARKLISVIDDDESVRRTTTLLIESFGFRAGSFESAEMFLRSGQRQDTSCLIVDVQMPGMNGLELQGHLAAEGCRIPIIFITAYNNNESRRRAMQAGAVAFLGKPFTDEQLLRTIRSALRHEKDGTRDEEGRDLRPVHQTEKTDLREEDEEEEVASGADAILCS